MRNSCILPALMLSWKWLFAFLFVASAFAELGEPLSIEQLKRESALVVHATVKSKTVFREKPGAIATEVRLDIIEVWKGQWDQPTLSLMHPGGVLGEHAVRVTGQPNYLPGEEVILFLTRAKQDKFVTLGLGWGKFEVTSDSAGAKFAAQASATGGRRITLPALKERIRQ